MGAQVCHLVSVCTRDFGFILDFGFVILYKYILSFILLFIKKPNIDSSSWYLVPCPDIFRYSFSILGTNLIVHTWTTLVGIGSDRVPLGIIATSYPNIGVEFC